MTSHEGDIRGVLFLDVDGTLTRPGSMYAIDEEPLDVITQFIYRGGTCVFNTGATLGRLERTVFNPIFCRLDGLTSVETAKKIFQERVIAAPENGSAVCLNTDVRIVENELNFRWQTLHTLEVPTKQQLRDVIQREMVPLFENSLVVGNAREDDNPRQYILSWKGITDTRKQVRMIQEKIIPNHPEVDWENISMKAARKTIDFVHSGSGKKNSTEWMLRELGSLEGPILGFGDLGDEFAQVVPTINVNRVKPNEFRARNMPAMELNRWELLVEDGYVVLGEGKDAIVRNKKTDKEIQVLRDKNSEIIYARQIDNGPLVPDSSEAGYPVEIQPFYGDAGKGTALVLRELMDRGYFSVKRKT
jgi:hydroxymethylpyrimidine pyrophosphatase-like HAD family hydrolase